MASNKDKALIKILVFNREIRETREEISELEEYIGYLKYTRTFKTEELLVKAERELKAYKNELSDIISDRDSELKANNFTNADYGHKSENYTDAKSYGAMKDIPLCARKWYEGNEGKYATLKYAGLNDEEFRFADDEVMEYYEKQEQNSDWSAKGKENFKNEMGMTVEEWRATGTGIWAMPKK